MSTWMIFLTVAATQYYSERLAVRVSKSAQPFKWESYRAAIKKRLASQEWTEYAGAR
jgi:hypothetical protein